MFFCHESERKHHKAQLERGLAKLGPDFCAQICWWCNGTTRHNFESCDVCGAHYGLATGLIVFSKPAPASIVNQVLIAGDDTSVACLPNCRRASGECRLDVACESVTPRNVHAQPNKLAADMIMDRQQR